MVFTLSSLEYVKYINNSHICMRIIFTYAGQNKIMVLSAVVYDLIFTFRLSFFFYGSIFLLLI